MMSRKITLKNEQISQFLRTDDAIKALETSVDNGQIRLSLQILVEIINDLNSNIQSFDNKSTEKEQVAKPASEKNQNKQKTEQTVSDSQTNI